MVQVVEQPANVEEPSPFPGPTQSLWISKLHGTVVGVAHQVGSQKGPLNVVLLSLWWEVFLYHGTIITAFSTPRDS